MIREYVIEYAEDRIGIGMIENRRKGGGERAWEVGGESSGVCGRGKFEDVGVESAWKV
jgi:hypothetical protein